MCWHKYTSWSAPLSVRSFTWKDGTTSFIRVQRKHCKKCGRVVERKVQPHG